MANKKYYWIKLKTDFFNREDIDFILSQENGCEYVVLYQMLCLNTANNEGKLETKMNEMIVPYDIKKIVRDCKYFDYDTVAVALDLYKRLGLIYEEENKILKIANYNEMVGSESEWAEKKRLYREKQKMLKDNVKDNVLQDIRDKSIDIRDIDIKENIKEKFKKPTLEEVESYCKERKNNVDPERFIDFYESKDWMIGKNKMKDWKACIRTWESKTKEKNLPKWFDKDNTIKETTKEEQEEIDKLLKDLGDDKE